MPNRTNKTITVSILNPFPPGLSGDDFQKILNYFEH